MGETGRGEGEPPSDEKLPNSKNRAGHCNSLSPQDELLHLPYLTETENEVLKGMFLLQSEQKEFSLL